MFTVILIDIAIIFYHDFSENDEVATKIICYTRSTPAIHQLPAVYPNSALSYNEVLQLSDNMRRLICEKV